jgi:hypothetical protein
MPLDAEVWSVQVVYAKVASMLNGVLNWYSYLIRQNAES